MSKTTFVHPEQGIESETEMRDETGNGSELKEHLWCMEGEASESMAGNRRH